MKNVKQQLLNEVLTGLMVAATLAIAAPTDVFAAGTDLSTAVTNTESSVFTPAMAGLSYVSYALGAVLVVAGIAGAKKHADAPANNALGPAVGKLAAGAAFLAAPSLITVMQGTGSSTFGANSATVSTLNGF